MSDLIRVLHVDDEPGFAEMAATFLQREEDRFEVVTETDSTVCLAHLDDRDIDCLVSDYDMPGLNGIELLEAVRDKHPDLPFILFTGKGSEEVAGEAISKGVTDYIQKERETSQFAVLAHDIRNAVGQSRSRKAKAQTEEKLTQLAEKSDDILFMFNGDWSELLFINSAYEEIWGRPVESVKEDPQSFLEGIHPDDRENARRSMETLANGSPIDIEYRVIQPDGDQRWIHGDTKPIVNDEGTVTRIVGYVRDITQQKRERQTLERTIRQVTDGIIEVDADWRFTLVNESAEKLTDMNEGNLLGREFWEVFDEAVGTRFEAEYRDVMETDEPTTFTEYFSQLDGWFDIDVYPRPTGGLSFYFRDVTDRVERTRELERQDGRFRYVEEVADIGYWEIDTKSAEPLTVSLSDGVYAIHDLSPDEPFDVKRGLQFYDPDHRPIVRDAVEQAIEEGVPYDHEVRLITAEGNERWVHSVGEPVADQGEIVKVRGVFQDITDRKEYEQKLTRQKERLDEFASIVSHDLRNPISVAKGRLDLASEDCDSEQLDAIDAAHSRMEALIDDLLSLARQGKVVSEYETVHLPGLVEAGWSNVETGNATFDDETERAILADESRLLQAIENLFSNAVEHGGRSVTVGEFEAGFYVADDGQGIPEPERESIFQSGYSTSDQGTGFGLRIVKEIVEAHGWEISVTERPDGGVRFEISGVGFV